MACATESQPHEIDHGEAGASAEREGRRRIDARRQRIHANHPRIGGLLLAILGDEQADKAWLKGAEGERKVGARIDKLAQAGCVALHDRAKPGSKANIDHILIAPSGVYVIDAKNYSGAIKKRDVGGWLRPEQRLYVAGRDQSKLVRAVSAQAELVRQVVGNAIDVDTPVTPVLCFTGAEWPLFSAKFEIDDVLVASPLALEETGHKTGPLTPEQITTIAAAIASAFKPA